MKKMVLCLLALVVALSATTTALAKDNAKVFLNDQEQDFIIDIVQIDNTELVPIRPMMELLGYTNITWDGMRQRATVTTKMGTIEIQVGSAFAWLNNSEAYIMPTYARIYNGQTMVPVKFISDATGATLKYSSCEGAIFAELK